MATLLRLIKAARGRLRDTEHEDAASSLVQLADAAPEDEATQVVGAYQAWVCGDDETAARLAARAIRPDGTAFPALLVLTALSAKTPDEERTYEFAQQLASAPRRDKTASRLARLAAGCGLFGGGTRRDELSRLAITEQTHDEWVHWAASFVREYEARKADV